MFTNTTECEIARVSLSSPLAMVKHVHNYVYTTAVAKHTSDTSAVGTVYLSPSYAVTQHIYLIPTSCNSSWNIGQHHKLHHSMNVCHQHRLWNKMIVSSPQGVCISSIQAVKLNECLTLKPWHNMKVSSHVAQQEHNTNYYTAFLLSKQANVQRECLL